jgi:hypothetical protein
LHTLHMFPHASRTHMEMKALGLFSCWGWRWIGVGAITRVEIEICYFLDYKVICVFCLKNGLNTSIILWIKK